MGCSGSQAKEPQAAADTTTAPTSGPNLLEKKELGFMDKQVLDARAMPQMGDMVTTGGGLEGMVVSKTTTDVLLNLKDGGGEKWVEMEDLLPPVQCGPLAAIKVGAVVTSSEGLEGIVQSQTTTDVVIKEAEGSELTVAIEDIVFVTVTLVTVTADWVDKSDPYCTCEIEGKPDVRLQTRTITDSSDVAWNHEGTLLGFKKCDSLLFSVWDKDPLKSNSPLGSVTLKSDEVIAGFYGELPLSDGGAKDAKLTVRVCVSGLEKPPLAEAEPERAAPSPCNEEEAAAALPDGIVVTAAKIECGRCCC